MERFMMLPEEYCSEDSYFYILPVPYEKDSTYGDGASLGPKEILSASSHLEYYDEQFDCEPFEKGICISSPLGPFKSPEEMVSSVSDAIESLKGKFVITFGGDHSVTIGAVQGLERSNGRFSVIVFDAHPDVRYSWNNSMLNHSCTVRRICEAHKTAIVGLRSIDKDDMEFIDENVNISVIKAYEYSEEMMTSVLEGLEKNVYISIDVDAFDISLIRNTGTPEPGGFFWDDMIRMIGIIFEKKNVIGADIVEFAPKENFRAEAFSLAKLAYKLFAMKEIYGSKEA